MPIMWRVENKEGLGPYRGAYSGGDYSKELRIMGEEHTADTEDHPIIDRAVFTGEICGFNTWEQLRAWFSLDELSICENCGYVVAEIEVREIIYNDGKQIMGKRAA